MNIAFAKEELWFAKAEKAFNQKNYAEAIKNFNEVIKKNSKNKEALYKRGLSYLFLEQADEAISDFTEVIKLDSNNIDAYNNRGLCYGFKGEIDLSIFDFKKAIALDKDFALAYLNLGSAFLAIQDYESAIKTLNKVVSLDTTNPENYFQRGSALLFLKKFEEAKDDFTKAIEKGLKIPKSYFNRASCLYQLQDYLSAINDLNKVIELDSMDFEAFTNRSVCYEKIGLLEKADEDKIFAYEIQTGLKSINSMDELVLKKFAFFDDKITLDLPVNWVLNIDTTDYGEIATITHDSIRSIYDNYMVGVKIAIDTNMHQQYNVKSVNEILGFWEYSSEINQKTYKEYEEHMSFNIDKGDYFGFIKEASIRVDDNSFPIRMYEIILVKEDILIYAYFQCPVYLFNKLKDLFKKSFESMEINF
jgi:tetratricopeptide (TPR) repeat protein